VNEPKTKNPGKGTDDGTAAGSPPRDAPPPSQGVLELRRRALAFGFGFVTLGILALLVAIYMQIIREILWASTLAILFYPLHRRILRLVRGRSTTAAVISTVLSIAILFIPAVLITFNLVGEVQNLWPSVQESLGPDAYQSISQWLEESRLRGVVHFVVGAQPDTGPSVIEAELHKGALWVQEFLLERLRSVTKSVPAALVRMGITLLAFFFFLRRGPGWIDAIHGALPLEKEHSQRLFGIAGQTVNAVFRGVLLTAATQAVLAGLGFWVAGAKVPLLLAFVTFIAALVPFVGPVAVWLPTAIVLFVSGHHGAGIGLAIYGTLVVSLVDNFLRPYLIGREMKLPVLWLFLSILGALKLFGFLGVIVGPAVLSLALACYRIYTEGRKVAA
jgi:predicted PurR-regulated permease PerM